MTNGRTREHERVPIRKLPTGVPGLDEILGSGLPEYSFNIVAGGPGCGKTTLAHQIVFANASRETPALYFTVLGEPAVKSCAISSSTRSSIHPDWTARSGSST